MNTSTLCRTVLLAAAAMVAPLSIGSAAASPEVTAVAPADVAHRPTPAEARAYAERERQAPAQLSKFEGGQVVIVLSTTAAIIALVVLLILIL